MTPLTRFLRFNLVGLLGILVQLTALAILNRALPHPYLFTSTLAVELTLLHNFLWHLHYTWPQTSSPLRALLRFHLSNGVISLFGNLILMRLFVHSLHAPVLLANGLAIACCGIANFVLAHHWVFANTYNLSLRRRFQQTSDHGQASHPAGPASPLIPPLQKNLSAHRRAVYSRQPFPGSKPFRRASSR